LPRSCRSARSAAIRWASSSSPRATARTSASMLRRRSRRRSASWRSDYGSAADLTKPANPVARAHEVGRAIEAAADEIERTQRIPEPLLSQLHVARLGRMLLPRSVDGDECEPWVYLRAIEEISRHDGSVGWNIFVANSSALIAPFLPPASMQAVFA